MGRRRELIVDSFAGGGGASLGIEMATGRSPDVAINHNAAAITMHAANHPKTRHFTEDVFRVAPRSVTKGKPVGLLWASPDCFPAGTLVLTSAGFKAIESVTVGELVLTHRNQWRRVNGVMSKVAATVTLRGHGHYGLVTTPNHQIYSKRVTKRYPKAGPDGKRPGGGSGLREIVENPYWPKAESMAGKLWATPRHVPPTTLPLCDGVAFGPDFFYFLGRWVGDGSLNKGDVEICCGAGEFVALSEWFTEHPLRNAAGEVVPFRVVDHGASKLIVWGNVRLVEWLREWVGDSCESKRLPTWAFGIQESWRKPLLDGYVDADGHVSDGVVTTSSVSRALSVGIRLLATTLGYSAAMYRTEGKPGEIEGRKFVSRDSYRVRWWANLEREQCYRDTNHLFSPVREVGPTGRTELVYCLEVDEDESYTADGIVVHNCKHFSRAKGSKPVNKTIRGLAWVVVKWAVECSPRVIILENVREFEDWGPLLPRWECPACECRGTEGQVSLARARPRCPRCESVRVRVTGQMIPDPARKGLTFRKFTGRLRNLGYEVKWRVLNAADFGSPTHRRRLFLVARRDGLPIEWPEPTHGDPKKIAGPSLFSPLKPWRTAAECIDWSIPCPSIFDRKKPLAEKTMRRIALGIKRYVLENPRPFLVDMHRENEPRGADSPLGTVTTQGNRWNVVTPVFEHICETEAGDIKRQMTGGRRRCKVCGKMPEVVTTPVIVPVTHAGERRANTPDEPLPTVTGANRGEMALVAPYLVPRYGERPGKSPRSSSIELPCPTVTPTANGATLVAAFLAKHFGGVVGHEVDRPASTVTGTDHHSLVAANLVHLNHGDKTSSGVDEPTRTVTATGTHAALVYSFLVKYFGTAIGQELDFPLHTATGKARFGLVTVMIDGEPYAIIDIGMRMLKPRELARAQGFPDSYILTGTATNQVERIGNSVCPQVAAAIVAANYTTAPATTGAKS